MEEEDDTRALLEQLSREINNLQTTVNNELTTLPIHSTPHRGQTLQSKTFMKPRDVPILDLQQLQGLEAAVRLQMFFELVEQCHDQDDERVQIAKSRVSPDLAILIHNSQSSHTITSWATFKAFFQKEFAVDYSVDRAWQQLESMHYDWTESPHAFSHRFICEHAVVVSKFPNEKFPKRDQTIKRKLWHGLPKEAKERIEGFLDEEYPLRQFIERIEHERRELERATTLQVKSAPEGKETGINKTNKPQEPEISQSEVDELKRQVRELKAQLATTPSKPSNISRSPAKYCAYCRSNSHTLADCWRKPPLGHCFDCRRPGCRRGSQGCPGRGYQPPTGGNSSVRFTNPHTSPTISIVVNGKLAEAVVDTGSSYTLVKESAVKRLGGEVNARRNPPRLHGVTGSPLRIVGMWHAEVGIGDTQKHTQWFPVVPDTYISTDLLLGCDVLGQAPLIWNGKKRVMMWGNTPYVVGHIPCKKGEVGRVTRSPVELTRPSQTFTQINLLTPVKINPHQTQFVSIPVSETPGTHLIVYPQSRVSQNSHPCLVQVGSEGRVCLVFTNSTKKEKIFRRGTIVGSYEAVEDPGYPKVNLAQQIYNDLVPSNDHIPNPGTRTQKLEELIKTQTWDHLTRSQRDKLHKIILHHEPLFIVDKDELGLISGPPAHIKVEDPQPCRGPMYRYPEQAKGIIADMLKDMEDRDIIEPSTAA